MLPAEVVRMVLFEEGHQAFRYIRLQNRNAPIVTIVVNKIEVIGAVMQIMLDPFLQGSLFVFRAPTYRLRMLHTHSQTRSDARVGGVFRASELRAA
jgi:hypothetical protein